MSVRLKVIAVPGAAALRGAPRPYLHLLQHGAALYVARPQFVGVICPDIENLVPALRSAAASGQASLDASAEILEALRAAGALGGGANRAALLKLDLCCTVALSCGAHEGKVEAALAAARFQGVKAVPARLPGAPADEEECSDDDDEGTGARGRRPQPNTLLCWGR